MLLISHSLARFVSQNTTDINSGRAFDQLKQSFPTWEEVRLAAPGQLLCTIPWVLTAHAPWDAMTQAGLQRRFGAAGWQT